MNPEYNRINAPIMRSPLLFRQSPVPSAASAYYSAQPAFFPAGPQFYYPQSRNYTLQPPQATQVPLPLYSRPTIYSPHFPTSQIPPPIPITACPIPSFPYNDTVSSKGLSLILIAILVLVALDLAIVRPQKLNTANPARFQD